ncbi:hypothetical protein AgCh_002430 [Apium graveolens]
MVYKNFKKGKRLSKKGSSSSNSDKRNDKRNTNMKESKRGRASEISEVLKLYGRAWRHIEGDLLIALREIRQVIKDATAQKNSFSSRKVSKPLTSLKSNLSGGTYNLHETFDLMKNNDQPKSVSDGGHCPWEPAYLHPNHEIAEIVIQVPLEKRESLKKKRRNQKSNQSYINLHDLQGMD